MKWLFAILVALNIIVFGNVVASKMIRTTQTPAAALPASAPAVTPTAGPTPEPVVTINPAASTPIAHPASTANTPPPAAAQTAAERRAEATAKARAEAAAKARSEATNTQNTPTATTTANINCSATAVLPEDDYHRIKGLLGRWPHAASRFVEQNTAAPKPKAANTRVRYVVAIDGGADMRARLKEQGFDTAINSGRLSLGVFNRRGDAEALLARAKISGFTQAEITQLGGTTTDAATPNASLSVAKMRITFIQVDDQAAQDINQVIQRYGRLQRSACKK